MDPATNAHALTDDVGFLLSRASAVFVRATNAVLASYGLRARPYSLLLMACSAPAGVSQRDLAETLALDPSQVVSLVDELAASALVERRPSETDRRAKLVVATEAGRALCAEVVPVVEGAAAAQLADLSATEQLILRELLTRLMARGPGASPQ
ncbi:MarR family transcriptional regulator [Blastococcus montanus]|uniref:MarR family winged helix-turn-helix transcriptional regulator n=1 Tax=Blastococcus montanus TaxID=3144973 RepID=UPI0032080758